MSSAERAAPLPNLGECSRVSTMNAPELSKNAEFSHLDQSLFALSEQQRAWFSRSVSEKRKDLKMLLKRTADTAAAWAEAATRAKGGAMGGTVEAEEWMSGPWALEAGMVALERTLASVDSGQPVVSPSRLKTLANGQLAVDCFPFTHWEQLLLNGFRAEVWMQPEVSFDNFDAQVAALYRPGNGKQPGVMLVLGAGNIASIPPLDVLHALFAEGLVCVCKMNPVNDYLTPFFERIFEPLIQAGFVAFVRGGADVGKYLVEHDAVTAVHITGSAQSHNTIVFGNAAGTGSPKLTKPITSELGGVGPTIVVPGPWSKADLRFQAEHVATQKLHNSGFNCIASQVLITAQQWPLRQAFLDTVTEVIQSLAPRPAYYPGAAQRQQAAAGFGPSRTVCDNVMKLVDVDSNSESMAFQTEFFGPPWAETTLDASDEAAFLEAAVDFANERLMGTLGAQLIIHPSTKAKLGARFEAALARLRYGTIGVNVWSGVGFLLPNCAWGAFPGHQLNDIQSGRGFVHNALLLEKPQKNVVYGPFAPAPRSLLQGEVHTSPKPPWFVTHRKSARVAQLLTAFEAAPSALKLPAIFAAALAG